MKSRSSSKMFSVKSDTISSKVFLAFFMIFIIVITPLSVDLSYLERVNAEPQLEQFSEGKTDSSNINNGEGIKKNVFYSLASVNSSSLDTASFTLPSKIKPSSNIVHNIELEVVVLPTGMPAYKMISHIKTQNNLSATANNDQHTTNLTSKYSNLATIPGPTLVVDEGDLVTVNIKDENGNFQTSEQFVTSKPGTFLYMENSKEGETGLFGAVIVNPEDRLTTGLVKGKIQELSLNKIDKDIILFMVGSTFWGMEIDNHDNNRQIPLWTNPNIGGVMEQKFRFHVLGVGHAGNPAGHQHTFHLHAHRWVDPGTNDIIDVKQIIPGRTHSFVIGVGDGVGPGQWSYHCHVFAHMEAGMMGGFKIVSGDPTINIPSEKGASPYKNFVAFELTDKPANWFTNLAGDTRTYCIQWMGSKSTR
ncbi:MAG: hypothetical protein ACM3X1_01435 [Ignavibacteriales bacterium]